MAKGKVKWFDPKKGFGFIVNEDGIDIFVHFSSIEKQGFRCLRTGQIVEFIEETGRNGLQGKKVVIVSERPDGIEKCKRFSALYPDEKRCSYPDPGAE